MEKPIIFSFFSGSGFLDLGFENNGFNIEFVNENHIPFLDAYRYSREKLNIDTPKFGYNSQSIEDLIYNEENKFLCQYVDSAKKTGSLIGFIGGPPCPDFSIGGKNKGKDGKNGKLTKVYIDVIIKCKPDFFIFENVKGLLRTKRHLAFYNEIKSILSKNGYLLTDRLINSIEYGVPQDRDRIILFGINENLTTTKSHNDLKHDFFWEKQIKYTRGTVFGSINWPHQERYIENSRRKVPISVKPYQELTVNHWFKKNKVNTHPNSKHHFIPREGLPKFRVINEGDDSRKSYKRLHRWRYSPTAAYGNNEVHLHPYKTRRISASEALAIQSLPSNFELPENMTLTNMFKTIGNGVPYLASEGIAKTVGHYLRNYAIQQ